MHVRRRKGSALVITVLIVTVIATLSFTVTGLTLSEFRKVAILQDGIAAYYAAEAGIEHGLMQQRLWKDSEVSKEYYTALHGAQTIGSVGPTDTPQAYLLGGSDRFIPGNAFSESVPWYGLKIGYKNEYLGSVDSAKKPVITNSSLRVYRDSALQLSVPKDANRLAIAWEPVNPNLTPRPELGAYFLEVTMFYREAGTDGLKSKRVIIKDVERSTANPNSVPLEPNTETVRIKPWDMEYAKMSVVMYNASNLPVLFDRQITTIAATGTVGQAKRMLEVNLNRSSQGLLEAPDFLLFTGDAPIIIDAE